MDVRCAGLVALAIIACNDAIAPPSFSDGSTTSPPTESLSSLDPAYGGVQGNGEIPPHGDDPCAWVAPELSSERIHSVDGAAMVLTDGGRVVRYALTESSASAVAMHRVSGEPVAFERVGEHFVLVTRSVPDLQRVVADGPLRRSASSLVRVLDVATLALRGELLVPGEIREAFVGDERVDVVAHERAGCFACSDDTGTAVTSIGVASDGGLEQLDRITVPSPQDDPWTCDRPRRVSATPDHLFLFADDTKSYADEWSSELVAIDRSDALGELSATAAVVLGGRIHAGARIGEHDGRVRVLYEAKDRNDEDYRLATFAFEGGELALASDRLADADTVIDVDYDEDRLYVTRSAHHGSHPPLAYDLTQSGDLSGVLLPIDDVAFELEPSGPRLFVITAMVEPVVELIQLDVTELTAPIELSRLTLAPDSSFIELGLAGRGLSDRDLASSELTFSLQNHDETFLYRVRHSNDVVELVWETVVPGALIGWASDDDVALGLDRDTLSLFRAAPPELIATGNAATARDLHAAALGVDQSVLVATVDAQAVLEVRPQDQPDVEAPTGALVLGPSTPSLLVDAYVADARAVVVRDEGDDLLEIDIVDVSDPAEPERLATHALSGSLRHYGSGWLPSEIELVVTDAAAVFQGSATELHALAVSAPESIGDWSRTLGKDFGGPYANRDRAVVWHDVSVGYRRVEFYAQTMTADGSGAFVVANPRQVPGRPIGVTASAGAIVTVDLRLHETPASLDECARIARAYDYDDERELCALADHEVHLLPAGAAADDPHEVWTADRSDLAIGRWIDARVVGDRLLVQTRDDDERDVLTVVPIDGARFAHDARVGVDVSLVIDEKLELGRAYGDRVLVHGTDFVGIVDLDEPSEELLDVRPAEDVVGTPTAGPAGMIYRRLDGSTGFVPWPP